MHQSPQNVSDKTYSSAESWEYIRAKLLLLVLQSPKKLSRVAFIRIIDLAKFIGSFNATSITCSYANHVPKSTSENQQVCLHGEKYIEKISISNCLLKIYK